MISRLSINSHTLPTARLLLELPFRPYLIAASGKLTGVSKKIEGVSTFQFESWNHRLVDSGKAQLSEARRLDFRAFLGGFLLERLFRPWRSTLKTQQSVRRIAKRIHWGANCQQFVVSEGFQHRRKSPCGPKTRSLHRRFRKPSAGSVRRG